MPKVKLRELQPGVQLAKDAMNTYGRLLLTAGVILEERHLEVLRTWGVVEVEIVGDESEGEDNDIDFASLPAELKSAINRQLQQQFKHCDLTHPMLKELALYRRSLLVLEHLKGVAS